MKPYQSHKKHGTNYSFLTLQREQKELEKFKKLEYEKALKITSEQLSEAKSKIIESSKEIKESAIQAGKKTSKFTQKFVKSTNRAYSEFKEEFKGDKNKE